MIVKLDDYITPKKYFKWKEALYLNSIKTYHSPSQQEVDNIIETCKKLDKFREYIGKPFEVHCWIRPTSVNDESGKHTGFNYNALISKATLSSHIPGLAIDFHIVGLNQDAAMKLILVKLKEFEMCSENNNSKNGRNWIHLQNRKVRNQWGINYDI
jgi:hypothetical protein